MRVDELGRGQDHLGVGRGDRARSATSDAVTSASMSRRSSTRSAFTLRIAGRADARTADRDDLHRGAPSPLAAMMRCTSATSVAAARAGIAPGSLKMFASSATLVTCASGVATARPITTRDRVVVRVPEDDRLVERDDREAVGQHIRTRARVREREPGRDHDVGAEFVDDLDHARRVARLRRPGAHERLARQLHRLPPVGGVRADGDGGIRKGWQRHAPSVSFGRLRTLETCCDDVGQLLALFERQERRRRPRSAGRPRGR